MEGRDVGIKLVRVGGKDEKVCKGERNEARECGRDFTPRLKLRKNGEMKLVRIGGMKLVKDRAMKGQARESGRHSGRD